MIELNKIKMMTRVAPSFASIRRDPMRKSVLPWILTPFTDDLVKTLKISNKARACLKSCVMFTKESLIALKEAPSQYSVGAWKVVLERISHLMISSK